MVSFTADNFSCHARARRTSPQVRAMAQGRGQYSLQHLQLIESGDLVHQNYVSSSSRTAGSVCQGYHPLHVRDASSLRFCGIKSYTEMVSTRSANAELGLLRLRAIHVAGEPCGTQLKYTHQTCARAGRRELPLTWHTLRDVKQHL